jgi:hypothetical protein
MYSFAASRDGQMAIVPSGPSASFDEGASPRAEVANRRRRADRTTRRKRTQAASSRVSEILFPSAAWPEGARRSGADR